MKRVTPIIALLMLAMLAACETSEKKGAEHGTIYNASSFGIVPGTGDDMTEEFALAIATIKEECAGKPATLLLAAGEYDFYSDSANVREYYISNHDQDNPKRVAVVLEGAKNITIAGDGEAWSEGTGTMLMMNGRMLPIAIVGCEGCAIENVQIDTRVPHIAQAQVLENSDGYITYRLAPYVNYRIDGGRLVTYGSNWALTPQAGIAFDGATGHVVYGTSDIGVGVHGVEEIEPRVLRAPWNNDKLLPGTVVAMRSYARPTPGIFVSQCSDTRFKRVAVHYAEGMALLAQVSENITLDGFCVAPCKGSGRYFSTQADATHFSACKGVIRSMNGLYDGMMDDAINVHGTYLRVVKRIDDHTLVGRYMHGQAYGFYWGGVGDSVQFVRSDVMEVDGGNRVAEIVPHDRQQLAGCKEFRIRFEQPLPVDIANGNYGIENLEWTPEVLFAGNTVRNNRARGALFSTPKRTVVEDNLFDHTSGTAILLCGDCNGWFETGACRDVVIRNNRFVNALTSMFQFTNAIISVYPEIPNLAAQQKYFHGGNGRGVTIENNVFETFDAPIVYAKSLDGLLFRGNKVVQNDDFKPFHWNRHRFLLERVTNVVIEDNEFDGGFDEQRDVVRR